MVYVVVFPTTSGLLLKMVISRIVVTSVAALAVSGAAKTEVMMSANATIHTTPRFPLALLFMFSPP
jgi:hypothetical protein